MVVLLLSLDQTVVERAMLPMQSVGYWVNKVVKLFVEQACKMLFLMEQKSENHFLIVKLRSSWITAKD